MLTTHEGRPLLISRPQSNQYGHLGLEMHLTLCYAREHGADVFLVRDRDAVNHALYEVDTSAVRVLRETPALSARMAARLTLHQWNRRRTTWGREWTLEFNRATRDALGDYCIDPDVPEPVQNRLRGYRQELAQRSAELEAGEPVTVTAYVERTRIREPFETFIRPELAARAQREAAAFGVEPGMKLVCVHARESGYKRGREVHDSRHKLTNRNDATRNARIETYFDAIDHLTARGFTVVRVGDPSMEPVRRPGVIDLATHPGRTALGELHCLFASQFLVCGESGPLSVAYLTNTPVLTVNSTDPIGGYPMRRDGFYILKGVIERVSGRRLSLRDLLTEDYLEDIRDTKRFVYVDNTPDEITAVVDEMLEWLAGTHVDSEGQAVYRSLATDTSVELRERIAYVRKHGPDRGFLGDGRIGRRYLQDNF